MKKLILFVAVAVSVTTTSCRKTYTCTCDTNTTDVYTQSGTSTTTASTSKSTVEVSGLKRKNKGHLGCTNNTQVQTYKGGTGNNAYTDVQTSESTCTLK